MVSLRTGTSCVTSYLVSLRTVTSCLTSYLVLLRTGTSCLTSYLVGLEQVRHQLLFKNLLCNVDNSYCAYSNISRNFEILLVSCKSPTPHHPDLKCLEIYLEIDLYSEKYSFLRNIHFFLVYCSIRFA